MLPVLSHPLESTYADQLPNAWVEARPLRVDRPRALWFNEALAHSLGWVSGSPSADEWAAILSGQTLLPGSRPIAQAYAGHQFGRFSPQLGDGRALLLGEWVDRQGRRWDLGLKGSGRTVFSRGGDGKAAVGPMLREALLGEAMHALGIPSTRALGVVGTGEWVYREQALPGAMLARVASSHLRVGTFEFFSARGDRAGLQRLLDYTLRRHPPGAWAVDATQGNPALALLLQTQALQARLVAQWEGVGFIHGVMNTDNMTLSGETIDYGPCAFLETYHPDTVFSSIDTQGRYAFGQQASIAHWNLARLAEALLPLVADDEGHAVEQATAVLHQFPELHAQAWAAVMAAKLGLEPRASWDGVDAPPRLRPAVQSVASDLAHRWWKALQDSGHDTTRSWAALVHALPVHTDESPRPAVTTEAGEAFAMDAWSAEAQSERALWRAAWMQALPADLRRVRDTLLASNPIVIPRNHLVEAALAAASTDGDLQPFHQLMEAIRAPYDPAAWGTSYAEAAAPQAMAGYRTFCGT
jgi:uncharacterized protein YdiU (UPF0061 family)